MQNIILAGGCFWGLEKLLSQYNGVIKTSVGYIGGAMPNPTYDMICTGQTGHAEAVSTDFDPEILSLENLLRFFFTIHDPTTLNRQGNDIGTQYRSSIFYHNDTQKIIAAKIIADANQSGKFDALLVTQLEPATQYYIAEDYHQNYLLKNPHGYNCHSIHKERMF